jgi:hypothetical protein
MLEWGARAVLERMPGLSIPQIQCNKLLNSLGLLGVPLGPRAARDPLVYLLEPKSKKSGEDFLEMRSTLCRKGGNQDL